MELAVLISEVDDPGCVGVALTAGGIPFGPIASGSLGDLAESGGGRLETPVSRRPRPKALQMVTELIQDVAIGAVEILAGHPGLPSQRGRAEASDCVQRRAGEEPLHGASARLPAPEPGIGLAVGQQARQPDVEEQPQEVLLQPPDGDVGTGLGLFGEVVAQDPGGRAVGAHQVHPVAERDRADQSLGVGPLIEPGDGSDRPVLAGRSRAPGQVAHAAVGVVGGDGVLE